MLYLLYIVIIISKTFFIIFRFKLSNNTILKKIIVIKISLVYLKLNLNRVISKL